MSSWLRPSPRPSYIYIPPLGTFQKKTAEVATVVSAYYEMKSKYTKDDYKKWIRLFLETIRAPIVFFTEEYLVSFIQECRKDLPIRIVVYPREDWLSTKRFPPAVWETLHGRDQEKNIHAPELYKVWYEKNEFVRRAIELNPFGHTDFVWTDAGILRSQGLAALVSDFPVVSRIPVDRILVLNIMPFVERDNRRVEIDGQVFIGGGEDKPRIGGGVLAASATIWTTYIEKYHSLIERFSKTSLFWGKDQTIMKTMYLENKNLFSFIQVHPVAPEPWFYSLLYLGATEKLVTYLQSVKDTRKISYESLGRIK